MKEQVHRTPTYVAYLVSQYPATSHTFISREIAALRALGVRVETFSIRPLVRSELEDKSLAAQSKETYTVLSQPVTQFVAAQLQTLFTQPGAYVRTLARALRHRVPGLRGFAMSFAYFAEALLLARELRKRDVSRLHNHFANAGAIVGYLAAGLLKIPWSFTLHGISETDYPSGLLLGKKIEAAEFVACVSYFGRSQAMRVVSPELWPKLKIVRCGLDLRSLPRRGKGSMEGPRIICVGRLSAEKGQAGLLEAFARVIQKQNIAELVFVGDGPERDQLTARAAALGLAERVTFSGRLSEQETLEQIANSDILVLASFMEGLPIVLVEAMAMGTPVIASRVAGIPELIEDEKSGLLFTPSDWAELADCMSRLLNSTEIRTTLAARGRAVVKGDFDSRKSAEQMIALFAGDIAR